MSQWSWTLRLLGAASMLNVALALPSERPSLSGTSHQQVQQRWCSFDEYGAHFNGSDDLVALDQLTLESPADNGATIHIPVDVFMLGSREIQSRLNKTSPVVRLQDSLAEGYSSLGYSFGPFKTHHIYDKKLAEIVYTPSDTQESLEMKGHLRNGGPETLNIYIVPRLSPNTLAFAVLPQILLKDSPVALALDGIVVSHFAAISYLWEKTIVHEVGHFLGLRHPFQGACKVSDGDDVPDTPQAHYTGDSMCTVGKDSCPGLPGVDLVRNYMMYSSCTTNLTFTPGQASKMRQSWYRFRDPKTRQLPPSTNQTIPTAADVSVGSTSGSIDLSSVEF